MNRTNKDLLECIERVRLQIKIENLIAEETGEFLSSERYYRLFNLYSMLDIDNLIEISKEY